jgi:hypothetical protein
MVLYIHVFFTWALAGGEWSASRPGRFTPEEKAPSTYWIGGWVGPRAGMDDLEKRKFLTVPGLEIRNLVRPARLSYPGSHMVLVVFFFISIFYSELSAVLFTLSMAI